MNEAWETWLTTTSSEVCLITVEAAENQIIFQVDNTEYRVVSP